MAKFTVAGKKVFLKDELVELFEKLEGGLPFDDHTAGYLLVTSGGNKNMSPMEMARVIEEGIKDHEKMVGFVAGMMPEMERIASEG